jgi:tyrosinase
VLLSISEKDLGTYADEEKAHDCTELPTKGRSWIVIIVCLAIVGSLAAATSILMYAQAGTSHESAPARCQNPSIRREWRTLSTDEKRAYLDAVVCLTSTPSIVGRNQTLFDGFPWIHTSIGKTGEHRLPGTRAHVERRRLKLTDVFYPSPAHHSAPFLAWHRYFLHIYETQLRSACHYSGSLVCVSLPHPLSL